MLTREEQEKEVQELNASSIAQGVAESVTVVRTKLPAFEVEAIKAKVEEYRMRMDEIKKRYEALLAKRDEATLDTVREIRDLREETNELRQDFEKRFEADRTIEEIRLFSSLDTTSFFCLFFSKITTMEAQFYIIAKERIEREEEERKKSRGCSCCQRHIHGWYY